MSNQKGLPSKVRSTRHHRTVRPNYNYNDRDVDPTWYLLYRDGRIGGIKVG